MEESNSRKSDGDVKKGRLVKEQTMEYHLKAAHILYCDEVRVLKLQVKALKSRLKENVARGFKCSQCESIQESLEKQAIAFEEKLREKNKIICELRHKLELKEFQTSNGSFGSADCCSKKRRLLSRKDCIQSKEIKQLNPSSDDDVTILKIKSSCTNLFDNYAEKSTEFSKPQSDKQHAGNRMKSENFVDVPETLVEDMGRKSSSPGNQNKVVVVPETLHMEFDFSGRESPVFNNCSSQATIMCTMIDDSSAPRCSPVKVTENPICDRMINESLVTNSLNDVKHLSDAYGNGLSDVTPNENFHELLSKDPDESLDEFQIESARKRKFSKSTSSFVSKPTATRTAKTPSPHSKYKLHISPAREGHRKPKYKQTTLTQKTFAALQESEMDKTISDSDLNRAIQESLLIHQESSLIIQKSHVGSRQQETMIADEHSDVEDSNMRNAINDSYLDTTFVSSQILKKTLSRKHCSVTSKTKKSSATEETKVESVVDDISNSEDLIQQMLNQSSLNEEKNSKTPRSIPAREGDNCFDDFDIVPNHNSSPNYKYKQPAVRKQNERRKLDGFECKDCAAYVAAMGLGDEEKKKRLKECSRHRGKYALPATPEHFWSIDFPSTQECKERGMMKPTQYKPLQPRRRRK